MSSYQVNSQKTIQEKAFSARQFNTLHGFNTYTDDQTHIIGILQITCSEQDNSFRSLQTEDFPVIFQKIKDLTSLEYPIVQFGDFIGRDYIKVKFTHRSKIPEIVNAVLAAGCRLNLQNGLTSATYSPGDSFSLEKSEELEMNFYNKYWESYTELLRSKVFSHGDARLWKSKKGKEFARKLKNKFPYQEIRFSENEPIFLPECGQESELIDYPLVVKIINKDNKEENKEVEETPDKKTCCKCRVPITKVNYKK